MKPSEIGFGLMRPGASQSGRESVPHQLDLFAERGSAVPRSAPKPRTWSADTSVAKLSDDDLLERIPKADPSEVEAVCAESVSRALKEAVPALEALWRRFVGFGIETPLVEQLAVVDALARLGCADARSALSRIVLSKSLPASLLPAALQCAAQAGLALPAPFVGPLLEHGDTTVRGAAFELAARANVATDRLRAGLLDRSAACRRLAAIAIGLRGDPKARQPLYDELARLPSAEVVEAITAVWDDDAIVLLGRCARRHPALTPVVLEALREIGTQRAETVARHVESATRLSTTPGH